MHVLHEALERTLTLQDSLRLLSAVQDLSRLSSLDDVMATVRRAARELSGADGVTFVLREGDQVFYADEDAIDPLWKGQRFSITQCVSGWAIEHRQTVAIEDIYADDRVPTAAYRATFVRSLVMVPIRKDDPVGAIGAYWARPHRATPREAGLLEALAGASAVAVENARLYTEARRERERAEEAARRKDEFLAMLGHELRNPLAPILTAVELMKLRDGATLPREVAVIERQTRHMARLVDDLLDVSRIARGAVELHVGPLDLHEVLARAMETVSPLLEQRGHQLDVSADAGLWVRGDVGRLTQVVANLLNNAAKYTPKGGVVAVSARRVGDAVELRVRDDGAGISPEMLPRVFDLFAQESQTIERSRGGLGLGLAIVKNLTELHGGTVTAASAGLGRGSEFCLRLPFAPPSPADRPPPRGARVLLVDDNAGASAPVAFALRSAGYDVLVARDGPEALSLATAHRPSLALVDLDLPLMGGDELARQLRLREDLRPITLVALSGHAPGAPPPPDADPFDARLPRKVDAAALRAEVARLLRGG